MASTSEPLIFCVSHANELVRAYDPKRNETICFKCDPSCRKRPFIIPLFRASNRYAIPPHSVNLSSVQPFIINGAAVIFVRRRIGGQSNVLTVAHCKSCGINLRALSCFCSVECAGTLPKLCQIIPGRRAVITCKRLNIRKQSQPSRAPYK